MEQAWAGVRSLERELSGLGWVRDLFVAGSLALGDYVPGVSDVDLVAVVGGPVDEVWVASLAQVHRALDAGVAAGLNLGCVYVEERSILDHGARHPTWTHGDLVRRPFSKVTRAELVRHGRTVFGRAPLEVLPPMTDNDLREAAREELCGYWAWATRHPTMWLNPTIADLSLTSMARGRHTLHTGHLMTKTQAIEYVDAPPWLITQLRRRRAGEHVISPPLPTAWIAWRDARRTVAAARR